MNRIQLTNNLYLDEYIPHELYLKYEKKPHLLIGMLSKELIKADQILRNRFGSVTINNWWRGGERNESGLRIAGQSNYSITSGHATGRASDKLFNVSSEEVLEFTKKEWKSLGITEIELGTSWVHSGTRFYMNQTELITYSV